MKLKVSINCSCLWSVGSRLFDNNLWTAETIYNWIRWKAFIKGKLEGTVEAVKFLFRCPVQVLVVSKKRRNPRNNQKQNDEMKLSGYITQTPRLQNLYQGSKLCGYRLPPRCEYLRSFGTMAVTTWMGGDSGSFPRKVIHFLQPHPEKKGLQQQQAKVTLVHHSAKSLVPCIASDKADYFVVLGSLFLKPGKYCRISTYSFAIRANFAANHAWL